MGAPQAQPLHDLQGVGFETLCDKHEVAVRLAFWHPKESKQEGCTMMLFKRQEHL